MANQPAKPPIPNAESQKLHWPEAFTMASKETASLVLDIFEQECRKQPPEVATSSEIVKQRDAIFVARFLPSFRSAPAASYYDRLHINERGYRTNNWLVERADEALASRPRRVTEVACGNGMFLRIASTKVGNVLGLDFARSPLLADLPSNVEFTQGDAIEAPIPPADLICSADFLEHVEAHRLPALLRKMHTAGTENYHVIACYDDGHSHATVVSPGIWLALFRIVDKAYRLHNVSCRREDAKQLVCVITNRPE